LRSRPRFGDCYLHDPALGAWSWLNASLYRLRATAGSVVVIHDGSEQRAVILALAADGWPFLSLAAAARRRGLRAARTIRGPSARTTRGAHLLARFEHSHFCNH
jgi:hypothetical protein